MVINLKNFWDFPSKKRIAILVKTLKEFTSSKEQPAKLWLQLLELMSSTRKFVPGVRLRRKPFQFALRQAWDMLSQSNKTLVVVHLSLLEDMIWWRCVCRMSKGLFFKQWNPDLALFSDTRP